MRYQKSKIKDIVTIPVACLIMFGAVLALPTSVNAFWPFDALKKDNQTESQSEFTFPPIIQKIIEKFGLNQEEVKSVIDEERRERQAEMQSQFEEKLNEAVENGKITEEQKNKILQKHQEMMQNKQNWQDLTPEERREKAQQLSNEMQDWAESEGINLSDIIGFSRRMGKPGFGHKMGMWK